MDEEQVAGIAASLRSTFAGVWPDNVATVGAFVAASSQWRTAAVLGKDGWRIVYVGLDYAGVCAALDAYRIEVTPTLFDGLRVMEAEAVAALNGNEG